MDRIKEKKVARKRKSLRIRKKVKGSVYRPRLSVFRSSKHIYAQIINDEKGQTLVSASELEKDFLEPVKDLEGKKGNNEKAKKTENMEKEGKERRLDKTERAKLIGKMIAQKALKLDIKKVVFDRGGYKYHGRVKALAEEARKEGLKF